LQDAGIGAMLPDAFGEIAMETAQSEIELGARDQGQIVGDVIAGLTASPLFPYQAVKLATEHWEIVLPALLGRLDGYLADPTAVSEEEADLLFFFLHLCGQQRETRAYRPLMRLCALPSEQVDMVLGDATTVTLGQIAASVFDGDPAPIHAVILDSGADEFVRDALFEALAFLTAQARIPLADTKAFLIHCDAAALQPRQGCCAWLGWQSAISYLGLQELREAVRRAFADERIGSEIMDFEDFEQDLRAVTDGVGKHDRAGDLRYFGDIAEEIAHWHGFTPEAAAARLKAKSRTDDDPLDGLDDLDDLDGHAVYTPQSPVVNPLRHVGRNDPCPCGSGKKYKKCCLR
jgi:hypothetical protein